MTIAFAAVFAGVALWLLLPGSRSLRPGPRRRGQAGLLAVSAAVAPLGWAVTAAFGVKGLVLGVIATFAASAGFRMVRRDRARAAATQVRRDVVEICETLAGEVRAGSAPPRALARTAEQWPLLSEVAKAADLGGDVPAAFRQLASRPGAESLTATAAAWQVSEATGAGLAAALERCAEAARVDLATADLVAGELATARATSRLLALLPLVVLTLGRGMGLDPWSFLLGTWFGVGCLGAGLALAWVGLTWVERIGEAAVR